MKKAVQLTKILLVTFSVICSINSFGQIIGLGSNWHYLDNGTDQGTTWKNVGFDDSAWSDGNAALGYPAGGGVSTVVNYGSDANNKFITTYFRKNFTIPDISQIQFVKLTLKRDDGAVIYINGNEVVRSNMPAGAFTYQTLAPLNENVTVVYALPASAFVQGTNLIAVEIHQTALTSSDILFDLSLENVVDQPIIGAGTVWKFKDSGTDLGTTWTGSGFDDSAWTNGIAPLGYGMTGVLTTVSYGSNTNAKYPTTYFRKTANIPASMYSAIDSVKLTLTIDDGAVVHLNGTEIFRRNLAAGTVTYSTLANVTVGTTASSFIVTLPKTAFLIGNNTFAIEIHQVTANSSDIYFDLSAQPIANDINALAAGSAWLFNDSGANLGTSWSINSFNDASWSTGNAPLGYGNGDEATTVSYGSNIAQKHITTYFRKHFNIASTAGLSTVKIQLKRDDAAMIYLNGVNVYRNNLPMGTIAFQTTALGPIEGAEENQWMTIYLPISALQIGDNVIAVEVHKFNATETDLRFDLKIDLQSQAQTATVAAPFIDCDPSTNMEIGCFTSVKPSAQTAGLVIPSTHTFQKIMKQGTTGFYTNTANAVPLNNDFTGFIPTNGSSTLGVLSVNHENDPGDVSLVSLHFNDNNKLWVKDSARQVDFTPLVRTTRNCSGGVTPWGTVVTSEETYTTGDVNGDGYHDRGWQVEIDPVTGRIVDQDGNGTPDKLWAMGRMNHENICVSADSTVAYQAEDGGTSGVYKYVMTVKGQLKAGTLYVLKRDNATSTTGTWVQVPNTTIAERNTVSSIITSLGGTNWNGPEDIEFGPDGKMYFTSKGTGTVWRFNDNGTTVSNIEAWVTNTSYPITYADGTINESWGTGIDNLAFDNEGNCWAQQDGGRGHLWVIRPDHTPAVPKIDLFCVTPTGSEPTGLTFTPDGRYGFVSFQHPSGTTAVTDANNENVTFNGATTIVFSRKEFLGAMAIEPKFELGNAISACDSVQLTANTTADVVNVWNDNSTSTQRYVTQTGWYKATAYANNGRSYSDSIFVTITPTPEALSVSPVTACFGTSLSDLNTSGNNVVWYNDAGLSNQVHTGNTFATGLTSVGTTTFYATQSMNGCVSSPTSALVTIHSLPTTPTTTGNAICFGETPVAINATGTNIKWYSDASASTLVGTGNNFTSTENASGTYNYYATETDANNCVSNAANTQYIVRTLPVSPSVSNTTICQGAGNPQLTAVGSSVQWFSNAGATALLTSGNNYISSETAPGSYNYYVTQTDGFNCESNSATVTFNITALPASPVLTNATSCFGTATPALTASGTNVIWYSNSALTTQVQTGNNFATGLTAAGTTTYYATQTANGCASPSATAMVTINALPSSPVLTGNAICFGDAAQTVSSTGTNVRWYSTAALTDQIGSGNTYTSIHSVPGNYTYYATQTDANGCRSNSAYTTYTIRQLPVSPTAQNASVCETVSNPVLNANGTGVKWYSDAATSQLLNNGNTFTSPETADGTYNYYVTQTDNFNCESQPTSVSFTIHEQPSAPISPVVNSCFGSATPAMSAIGHDLKWYSNANLTTLVGAGNAFSTGMTTVGDYDYFVTQTSEEGCTSLPQQTTLSIIAIPAMPSVSGDNTICLNDVIPNYSATGSNVIWSFDQAQTQVAANGSSFTPAASTVGSTTYFVTQTVQGCTSSTLPFTITVNAAPNVSFSGLDASYGNTYASETLSGLPSGGTFTGTGIVGNEFDPSIAGVGGPYTITYTYTNPTTGCSSSTTSIVNVTSTVGMIDLSNGSGMEVYPNPATEEVNVAIELANESVIGLELVDGNGKRILIQSEQSLNKGHHDFKVNRTELQLATGVYFLQVTIDGSTKTTKITFQ